MLLVEDPGLLTTVQDAGRPGFGDLGVPVSGACDPGALERANALLGNRLDAPAVELTLLAPSFRVAEELILALAGADLGLTSRTAGPLAPDASYRLPRGDLVRPDRPSEGARGYLAVTGGIEVAAVLGSASTYVPAALGGIDGRALQAGDRVRGRSATPAAVPRRLPESLRGPVREPGSAAVVRVIPGPDVERLGRRTLAALCGRAWQVDPRSDRVGIRLGAPGRIENGAGAGLVSRPTVWGAVQVPADGRPIVLLADHQTVGGYPVLAVAIQADRAVLGQLAPGDSVRFEITTLERARSAALSLLETRAALAAFAATA